MGKQSTMSATKITVEQSWADIDRMTSSMRAAANSKTWDEVLGLSGTRHLRLMAHFKEFPVGPDNAEFYQARLTDMLSGEKELQQMAMQARKEVMREGLVENKNLRAVGAYLQQ